MASDEDSRKTQHSDAEKAMEHLRIIRSLMEKRQVYRAISAPAALILGMLSLMMAFYGAVFSPHYLHRPISYPEFVSMWAGVFILSGIYNYWLLHRESGRDGWMSQQMKMALASLAPPLMVGALVSILIGFVVPLWSSVAWVLFYGLALHSMWSFAPRSIHRLSWMFILCGIVFVLYAAWNISPQSTMPYRGVQNASIVMGLTFGGLHLFYGLMVFLRKREDSCSSSVTDASNPQDSIDSGGRQND